MEATDPPVNSTEFLMRINRTVPRLRTLCPWSVPGRQAVRGKALQTSKPWPGGRTSTVAVS